MVQGLRGEAIGSGPYARRRRNQPVRRPFAAALGMAITTKEREDADAQGSVSFHENKDKHVLRVDTIMGTGALR